MQVGGVKTGSGENRRWDNELGVMGRRRGKVGGRGWEQWCDEDVAKDEDEVRGGGN